MSYVKLCNLEFLWNYGILCNVKEWSIEIYIVSCVTLSLHQIQENTIGYEQKKCERRYGD
jgi:hypothetical protein